MRGMLALLAVGCGDPIIDVSYRGDPIWYVEGTINAPSELEGLSLGDEVRASLFWNPNVSGTLPSILVEQTSVTTEVRFPATFEIRVFERPALEHFVTFDKRYAVALLLIYIDEDRDGFYSAGDEIVGGTLNKALMFAGAPVPADQSPTGEAIPIGFSLAQLPLSCPNEDRGIVGMFDAERQCEYESKGCESDWRCNPGGWCEPILPLSITVLGSQFIAQEILCLGFAG